MNALPQHLCVWAASARYSLTRALMFRGDFIIWSLVELFWMGVNLLLVEVIYRHTDSIAGWNRAEMLLLLGTSLLIQRLLMGFFWSGLYDLGRNVRNGHLDFFLAQPGSVMFMVSTRKLDPDGLVNSVVALGLVIYAAGELGLRPDLGQLALYAVLVGCGLVIHYSVLMLSTASVFWLTSAQGVEGGYFSLIEFSRMPREAFRGAAEVIFVWMLPVVVVSNAPARVLLHGFEPVWALGLAGFAALWLGLAVLVFHRGLRRYASASS
ncbi:MAG: hypothetical protein FJ381_11145 [Verrucomicrobia bacterium]|nr:hypothetical protein [Verrucomicrobiota bacterium]